MSFFIPHAVRSCDLHVYNCRVLIILFSYHVTSPSLHDMACVTEQLAFTISCIVMNECYSTCIRCSRFISWFLSVIQAIVCNNYFLHLQVELSFWTIVFEGDGETGSSEEDGICDPGRWRTAPCTTRHDPSRAQCSHAVQGVYEILWVKFAVWKELHYHHYNGMEFFN